MPSFLQKFFPEVYKKTQEHGVESNYCKYDNQYLQLFTSSLYLAALVATMFASPVTRKLGRKHTMLIAGVFFIVGTILNAAGNTLIILIIGRIIIGCGVGFANQVLIYFIFFSSCYWLFFSYKFLFNFGGFYLMYLFFLHNRLCQCFFLRLHPQEFVEHLTSCSSLTSLLAFSLQTLSTMAPASKCL